MIKVESVRALSSDDDDVVLPEIDAFNAEGEEEKKIQVVDPTKVSGGLGGHTAYKILGQDPKGEFEVVRRYKEFLVFREALIKRWPGFFIPPIPVKTVKKMNQKVIDERCHLLN